MDQRRKNIALDAARDYWSFSEKRQIPKGYRVTVYDQCSTSAVESGFLEELLKKVDEAWLEEVGGLSKTGRLSQADFANFVNQVRTSRGSSTLDPNSSLVERWMRSVVDLREDVYLVEIINDDETKLLLVNTSMSQS
jgi:hypothetical protein